MITVLCYFNQKQKYLQVIAVKQEQHLKEYKEKLSLKRKLGKFRLKPEGPRKPEIVTGIFSIPIRL